MNEERESLPQPPAPPLPESQTATAVPAEPQAEASVAPLATFDLRALGNGRVGPDPDPAVAAGDEAGYQWRHLRWPGFGAAGALLLLGAVAALAHPGAVREFMLASLEVLPFVPLPLLAYLGVRRFWARVASYFYLGALIWGFAVVLLLITALTVHAPDGRDSIPAAARRVGAVALWELAAMALAAAMLAGPVRRRLSRFVPIDPRSPVHAVALSLVTAATVMLLGQLVAEHGLPAYLTLIRLNPSMLESAQMGLLSMLYGLVWTVPAALILVGWPVVRSAPAALARLGLVRPTLRQVLGAVFVALGLVVASQALDWAVGGLFHAAGWPRTDSAAFERLLGPAVSGWGALAVGVSAGLGEELIVRGALQPRLGLVLSALFFAGLHALQYGFDQLIGVFALGLVLGLVRARANTTTSAIVHGVYDFTVLLAAVLTRH